MKIKTVGLLGFGRFGSMAYQHLRDRVEMSVYDADLKKLVGIRESVSFEEVAGSDVVLLSVPISEMRRVCSQLRSAMKPGQIVVDTCSVKTHPVAWMSEALPDGVEILGTHPLFGPDSGKEGIAGLKMVVCPIRISPVNYSTICDFLRSMELVLIEATPEEHDRQIALSQAIFHLIAQALRRLDWGVKPISTPGPDSFFRLVKTVQRDTKQLFLDMERENPFAAEYRRQFIEEIVAIDQELLEHRKKRDG